jgi:arginine exporter protein ArgO
MPCVEPAKASANSTLSQNSNAMVVRTFAAVSFAHAVHWLKWHVILENTRLIQESASQALDCHRMHLLLYSHHVAAYCVKG